MIENKLAVIKLGGHAMDDAPLLNSFLNDIATLLTAGWRFVIVHGGGPHINALLKALGITSQFIGGLRVTDAETLSAVELALCAKVNKSITRQLLACGVKAVGISGEDDGLLRAEVKDPALGFVGRVIQVNPQILHVLLQAKITPIVAPLALDGSFRPLNVNADTAAGAIAGSLKADYFVLISDVPGVLDSQNALIPVLNAQQIDQLRADKVITGGMIPKVECCQGALAAGCARTLILNGQEDHALARYLVQDQKHGTEILP